MLTSWLVKLQSAAQVSGTVQDRFRPTVQDISRSVSVMLSPRVHNDALALQDMTMLIKP